MASVDALFNQVIMELNILVKHINDMDTIIDLVQRQHNFDPIVDEHIKWWLYGSKYQNYFADISNE